MTRPPTSFQNPGSRIGRQYDFQPAEHFVGQNWIDGKPIFRIVTAVASFPNNTTVVVPSGIAAGALDTLIDMYGSATNPAVDTIPLPYVSLITGLPIELAIDPPSGNLAIRTGTDRTAYSGFIIITYTKQ